MIPAGIIRMIALELYNSIIANKQTRVTASIVPTLLQVSSRSRDSQPRRTRTCTRNIYDSVNRRHQASPNNQRHFISRQQGIYVQSRWNYTTITFAQCQQQCQQQPPPSPLRCSCRETRCRPPHPTKAKVRGPRPRHPLFRRRPLQHMIRPSNCCPTKHANPWLRRPSHAD